MEVHWRNIHNPCFALQYSNIRRIKGHSRHNLSSKQCAQDSKKRKMNRPTELVVIAGATNAVQGHDLRVYGVGARPALKTAVFRVLVQQGDGTLHAAQAEVARAAVLI